MIVNNEMTKIGCSSRKSLNSSFNIFNLYDMNLKNYSQKHLCDFLCVWFCEKLSWFSYDEKNNTQTIIYARDHKNSLESYSPLFLCGFFNTNNNLRVTLQLLNNNSLGGEL